MSKDSTVATCSLELQAVWICSISSSRAVSVDLSCVFPIWLSGSKLYCFARPLSRWAITDSMTFLKVFKSAVERQAPISE
jgi:hypothetical protein